MTPTKIIMTGIAISALAGATQQAAAQVDRASRSDISDFRRPQAAPQAAPQTQLPVPTGVPGVFAAVPEQAQPISKPDISLTVSGSGSYATNPGQVKGGIDGTYGTPGIAFDYSQALRGWTLAFNFTVDGDYFTHHTEDFDESRLDGQLSLAREMKAGTLTFALRGKASFNAGFGDNYYVQERYVLGFAPKFAKAIALNAQAEYRASAVENQRRTIFRASGSLPLFTSGQASATLKQKVEWSLFRAGTNDGRRDVLSSTGLELSPGFNLGPVKLGVAALLFHNFSNRSLNRFTDFEIGPVVSMSF